MLRPSTPRIKRAIQIAGENFFANGHYEGMTDPAQSLSSNKESKPVSNITDAGKSAADGKSKNDGGAGQKSKASPPPSQTRTRRSIPVLAILALLVALAGAGGSGYLWYTLTQLQARTDNELSELRKSLRTLDDHPTVIELKQRVAEQDTKLAAEFAAQQKRITAIEQAFDVTQQVVNRDQRGWILAEVEYLMRLAIVRLRLMRDIKGATEALVIADQRLHDLADPAVLKIREVLASEITALKSMDTPDIHGAALRLLSITDRLSLLPTAKQPSPELLDRTPAVDSNDEANWYVNVWRKFVSALGFSRINAPVGASALRSEIYYVEQLIRLELEAARQALIRLDKTDFEKRILKARSLLDEHYNRNHEQVILLKADLTALLEANLFPDLPDISVSLTQLRKLQQRYQPLTNGQ